MTGLWILCNFYSYGILAWIGVRVRVKARKSHESYNFKYDR